MNTQNLKSLKLKFYKERNDVNRGAVDSVLTEIELIETRQNKILTELDIDSVIKKCISMFEERAELAKTANRPFEDFLQKAEYLQSLLPKQLSTSEMEHEVRKGIVETTSTNIGDMGKVMAWLKNVHGSSIDMKFASAKVRELLS